MSLKMKLLELGIEGAMLDELVHDAASKLASNVNNAGLAEQLEFLQTSCGYSEEDIMRQLSVSSPKIAFPDGFDVIYKSDYLKGRRYNELSLKAIKNAVEPIIVSHNAKATSLRDVAVFEFCMSAKYQTLNGTIHGVPYTEAKLFDGFDDETFDNGDQDRFELLAVTISGALEALFDKSMEYEIKSYGIMFDLE